MNDTLERKERRVFFCHICIGAGGIISPQKPSLCEDVTQRLEMLPLLLAGTSMSDSAKRVMRFSRDVSHRVTHAECE